MICADTIAQLCRSQTDASGLTLVEDKWVKFPEWQGQPGGVTGAVLLAESHLAIHTWPETGNVTIDVYVCNFSGDNSAKAQALMDGVVAAYAPQEAVRQQLWRGDIATNGVGQYPWVMEQLTENAAFGFRAHNVQRQHTPFQTLEMLDTPSFGRVMRLDDHFMTSEGEEFFYHECMAHPAAMAHPDPQQVLVIAPCARGLAEELLEEIAELRIVHAVAAVGRRAGELKARVPVRRRVKVCTSAVLPLLRRLAAQRVVGGAFLRVRQHGVGLVHLGHPRGGIGLLAHVGVVAARELAVGRLDVCSRGVAWHAQDLVVVLELHAGSPCKGAGLGVTGPL